MSVIEVAWVDGRRCGRVEDIPLLVWSCITRRQSQLGRTIERVPKRAMEALTAYAWPGNVRELENVVERALILSPVSTLASRDVGRRGPRRDRPVGLRTPGRGRARAIRRVLEACAWKIDGKGHAAAARLGLNSSTLRSRMRKLGIARPARPAEPGR